MTPPTRHPFHHPDNRPDAGTQLPDPDIAADPADGPHREPPALTFHFPDPAQGSGRAGTDGGRRDT
jgi:hypothetical protein